MNPVYHEIRELIMDQIHDRLVLSTEFQVRLQINEQLRIPLHTRIRFQVLGSVTEQVFF